MKRKDIQALHQLTREQLLEKLGKLQQELGKIKLDKKAGRLSNPRQVGRKGDDVARILTVLHQRPEEK